ncbi:Histone-lysine N-methyltransferase ATXR4 [Capsicum baccatum]|uniref:Histone-lysine N-methyltransferase ATXR4 n=1 Tax=Capsicum baccatum TaxID=33114 RepID=A0A2G2X575_CAPBA|nr:Histone-lysine N-methyltransferase ATXR4 [Capsicum baccatum]
MYWHVSVSILFGLNWPWDRTKISLSVAAKVEAEAAVGNAIYMLPSFYNHDCDPNAHMLWIESVNTKVKVLRDIEAEVPCDQNLISSPFSPQNNACLMDVFGQVVRVQTMICALGACHGFQSAADSLTFNSVAANILFSPNIGILEFGYCEA